MKKLIAILLILITALGNVSCGSQGKAPTEKQIVKAAINIEDVDTLDPHFAKIVSSEAICHVLFNKLVRFPVGTTDVEHIEGDLAQSWELSPDKLSLTFKLRQGVQWQKGFGEVTSEDVKFSLERIKTELDAVSQAYLQKVAKIATPDKYTVVVQFKQPDPFFLQSLSLCSSRIVCKAAIEKYGKDSKINPIGSGPYQLETYLPKEKVIVTANENYFRGKPAVERIEFLFIPDRNALLNAYLSGTVDVTDWKGEHKQMYDLVGQSKDSLVIDSFPGVPFYLWLDTVHSPTKDLRVRQALAHAIDTQNYVRTMEPQTGTWQVPSFGVVPRASLGFTEEGVTQYEYNPAKARELLAEAGYPQGLTIKGYSTQIATYRVPLIYLQDQLAKVGINYELTMVDYNTYAERKKTGEGRPLTLNVIDSMPDPYNELLRYFARNGRCFIFTGYDQVDQLLHSIESEFNIAKRKQVYQEIQRIVSRDLVAIPTHAPKPIMTRWSYIDLGYQPKENDFYYYEFDEKLKVLKH